VPTQLTAQAPEEQSWPEGHWRPQPPQLAGSVWKAVQNEPLPAPQASGVAEGQAQAPPVQFWPAGHFKPHPPQFSQSLVVSAQ
jgi:hypothetical protein